MIISAWRALKQRLRPSGERPGVSVEPVEGLSQDRLRAECWPDGRPPHPERPLPPYCIEKYEIDGLVFYTWIEYSSEPGTWGGWGALLRGPGNTLRVSPPGAGNAAEALRRARKLAREFAQHHAGSAARVGSARQDGEAAEAAMQTGG